MKTRTPGEGWSATGALAGAGTGAAAYFACFRLFAWSAAEENAKHGLTQPAADALRFAVFSAALAAVGLALGAAAARGPAR